MPRLPDGYTIALSTPKSRPSSSAVFIVETQNEQNDQMNGNQMSNQIESTKDFLIATDSPRPLHPKRKFKCDVKILERKTTKEVLQNLDNI